MISSAPLPVSADRCACNPANSCYCNAELVFCLSNNDEAPTEDGQAEWTGWLVSIPRWYTRQKVTHLSCENRAHVCPCRDAGESLRSLFELQLASDTEARTELQ